MINFKEAADGLYGMMVDIRRELHKHPEIDRNLSHTADLVESHLKKFNIRYKRYPNNGIIGEIGNPDHIENSVALRADMDALEVHDLKNVSYKSQNEGIMHACGHDAHTAILVAAGSILKSCENDLNGVVRLVFQPAEETDGGAKDMIEYGVLDRIKAIIGLHVEETINTGTVGIKSGVVSAASNPFKITITGKGSHGAYPGDGVDSIYIAAKIIENLQGIVSREISATDSAVITVGKINGGTAPNAICSSVVMNGILRTLGERLREFAKDRMIDVVESTARMYRGTAKIEFVESYPSYENNKDLVKFFNETVTNNSSFKLFEIDKPSMGVEDFAYYVQKVPGLYYKLGCRNVEKGIIHPAHGSYFDIDEECMKVGCTLQSMLAYRYLNNK